jgi:Tetratricopeptide repeat
MKTRKKKLGAEHPDPLTSMKNLAFTWKGTSKETETVRLMEECVQSRKRALRLNHPDTLPSCSALAAWKAEQEDVVLSVWSTVAKINALVTVMDSVARPTEILRQNSTLRCNITEQCPMIGGSTRSSGRKLLGRGDGELD